jgi:hypothetical protein
MAKAPKAPKQLAWGFGHGGLVRGVRLPAALSARPAFYAVDLMS